MFWSRQPGGRGKYQPDGKEEKTPSKGSHLWQHDAWFLEIAAQYLSQPQ